MRIPNMQSGLLVVGLALYTSGCAAQAQATGYAEVDAPVTFPDAPILVTVEPDVWVVRDSDVAVYYVDDYYWSTETVAGTAHVPTTVAG
jgi:hypothetical protein